MTGPSYTAAEARAVAKLHWTLRDLRIVPLPAHDIERRATTAPSGRRIAG